MSKFDQARDYTNEIVPKLWVRNGRYYAALTIPGKGTRRVAILTPAKVPATSLTEARAGLVTLEYELSQGTQIAGSADCPTLADFSGAYLEHLERSRAKDQKTIDKEACHLKRWIETTGNVRLDKLCLSHVTRHVEARAADTDLSPRTINLDVVALGNMLRYAKSEGLVRRVVTEDWKPLKHSAPVKMLLTSAQIESFCEAVAQFRNGGLVANFIRLMAYSGARRTSCFALKWSGVDFTRRQVTFSDETKYGKVIVVDFNEALEKLLCKLHVARGESEYVLPNPGHGQLDFGELYQTVHSVRDRLGLPKFTPHLLRHYFASTCLMSGVDVATVAAWLGHADHGATLMKVYAHLLASHRKSAAAKVNFGTQDTPLLIGEKTENLGNSPAPDCTPGTTTRELY